MDYISRTAWTKKNFLRERVGEDTNTGGDSFNGLFLLLVVKRASTE